jgi:hypothetical protein
MTTWVNDSVLVVKLSNIFKTWLHALHEILFQQLPSGEKNKLCMPIRDGRCRQFVSTMSLSTRRQLARCRQIGSCQ